MAQASLPAILAIQAAGGPHLIARTSWVYAASGANFLRTIARLAGERKELRIVADQIGAPTTASTIADTVAGIVLSHASNLDELFVRNGGVVNLACTGETSWHGFASAIVSRTEVARCASLPWRRSLRLRQPISRPRPNGPLIPGSTCRA